MKEKAEKGEKNLLKMKKKAKTFPFSPGIYFFKDRLGKIIYIGKAASLRDRVSSYFQNFNKKNRPIEWVLDKVNKIGYKKTDSVLEAYILEQSLIKKYQPFYNILGKDDKSFCYIVFTQEKFPRILIIRETDKKFFLQKRSRQFLAEKIIGPFTSRKLLEEILRILRKIFPFHSVPYPDEKKCFDFQIGLCPGPYVGKISVRDYKRNITAIKAILLGKKRSWIKNKEKQMKALAQKKCFEEAIILRNQILTLKKIKDISLLKEEKEKVFVGQYKKKNKELRIEGYDISSLSGQFFVGSMVVFQGYDNYYSAQKPSYRRFRIKNNLIQDDISAMKEVFLRRIKHSDWPLPDLVLIDGGIGHLKEISKIIKNWSNKTEILAVAKGPTRKKLDLRYFGKNFLLGEKIIRQIRDEAHRFAVAYHRKIRNKSFLTNN